MPPEATGERARKIHSEAIVIDGMNNSAMTGSYFESILRGGMTATNIPVSISAPFRETIRQLCDLLNLVDKHSDKVCVIKKAGDILEAKRQGKLGLILALEDTRQLEEDIDLLRIFYDLGIRRMALVYLNQNSVGTGKRERHDAGLTSFGVKVIQRMEDLGILIDLCHCSDRMLAEATEVVKKPTVFSHCNVKAVYPYMKNLSDEQLEWLATSGSVIGISGGGSVSEASERTVDKIVDHIDHVRNQIGIDYVGIGLAISEGRSPSFYEKLLPKEIYGVRPRPPAKGIETIERFPILTEKLVERGYSEAEIKKVLGGNFLRVFQAVWG